MFDSWSVSLKTSFADVWTGVVKFTPKLIVALVIFVVGWVVGLLLEKVVAQIVRSLKVDHVLREAKIDSLIRKAGFNLNSGIFLGSLVRWFIVVVFLVASFDVLGLNQVNSFLQEVVLVYLPQVIVAVLILLVAAVIAEVVEGIVVGASAAADIKHAKFLGVVSRWAIWIFAILMALFQLGVATPFVQTLFTGLVIALSLAFGLAFGLGGQGAAADLIAKLRSEISKRSDSDHNL
jgi:small-conductance mechanosensitive channel